jgi:hypothetical protein
MTGASKAELRARGFRMAEIRIVSDECPGIVWKLVMNGRFDRARTLQQREADAHGYDLATSKSLTRRWSRRPSTFRQFGHTFVTTMPRPVREGEMSAVDDAVSGARLEGYAI